MVVDLKYALCSVFNSLFSFADMNIFLLPNIDSHFSHAVGVAKPS